MKLSIEIDSIEEVKELLLWRDKLRDRIAQLESEPLRFSLRQLALRVSGEMSSLTPDQKRELIQLIDK